MRNYGHFIGGRFVTGEAGAPIDCRCAGHGALGREFGDAGLEELTEIKSTDLTMGRRPSALRHG